MKRKLSLLLSLMMVLTLIPMSSFAETSNRVDRVFTGSTDSATITTPGSFTTNPRTPELVIRNDKNDLRNNDSMEIVLSGGAEWDTSLNTARAISGGSSTAELIMRRLSNTSVLVTVIGNPDSDDVFRLPLVATFKDANEGSQTVEVRNVQGGFTAGTYTFATIGRSSVTMRSETKEKISRGGTQRVTFRIDETTMNAFSGAEPVTLRLPDGFTWNNVALKDISNPTMTRTLSTAVGTFGEFSGRDLTIKPNAFVSGTLVNSIFVDANISVSRNARQGDIDVVSTRGSVSPSNLVIAEYVDFVPAVRVDRVLDVVSGRNQEGLYKARVIVEENVAGTFLNDRYIEFSFDRSQASLQDNQTLRMVNGAANFSIDGSSSSALTGNGSTSAIATTNGLAGDARRHFDADKWDVRVLPVAAGSTNTRKLEIEVPFVVSAGFEGDLELTVKGAGIEEQTVVVAKATKPVEVEVVGGNTAELVLGLQGQDAPDIIITEKEAGALLEDFTYNVGSTGVYEINWTDAKIEVIEGNLELDEDATEAVRKGINVRVNRRSTTPSKIKISGVKVTLDRTVPYGVFNATMNFGNVKADHDRLTNNVGSKAYFNVVTPVQDGQRLTAVFTIGDANYTVNGEAMTLDAAPFISNNRTMLPIGTIAQVVGASVNYSPVTRTAIFTKDGVVVSMTLDQPFLTANGVVIPMDSAPVVVNSRAFVPMAFVAQAFGVPVEYDAATRTVTVN